MPVDNLSLVVNQSVDQVSAVSSTVTYAKETLWPRIVDLLVAPKDHPDMLWTLGPMIIALLLMQIYFGRNKDEELGWNTAFGNSIALIFISVSLLRGLFLMSGESDFYSYASSVLRLDDIKIIIIAFLFIYGLLLSAISFFHWIPESFAFFIMNGIPINVTAYVGIVLVNAPNVPLDEHTIFAGFLIFIAVYLVAMVIRFFVPASLQARIKLLQRKRFILDAKVRVLEHKIRSARGDDRKAKFRHKQKDYQLRSDAVQKVIDQLQREAS